MQDRGIIQYNRGDKCIVRAIVCIDSLRKWWQGPVTMFLEKPYPVEFEKVCELYNIDIIHDDNPATGTMVRSIELCKKTPYEKTMWLDTDTIVTGPVDEMFDYLDYHELAIPHFAGWWSDGRSISRRVKRFSGKVSEDVLKDALNHQPAINCGVFSFRKDIKFLDDWLQLAYQGDGKFFIPDETAFQTLYPQHDVFIAPTKYNVSSRHDRGKTSSPSIIHYHGQKHVFNDPLCAVWKRQFAKMSYNNTANINSFLQYADKRLKKYLGGSKDVTVVTAVDDNYIDRLHLTFPTWVEKKSLQMFPVIVFVNNIPLEDKRLDFLRMPNVKLISWNPDIEDQREKMLTAFVIGAANHVKTKYWLKLDADSFATDDKPFVTDEMKQYVFCGHRWGYSWAKHISGLDAWASTQKRFKGIKPMYDPACVKGEKYWHSKKRTISFIQLNSTKFTRLCAKLCGGKRLPVPSQDTYMYYVADRLGYKWGTWDFKNKQGFTQGKGSKHIKRALQDVQ